MEAQIVDSIYNLTPLEQGGTRNRQGIGFQDHVAADFCLDMLQDDTLLEVWCETQDDITLIWDNQGEAKVEFVQVKSNEFDQLWTVAILCKREGKENPRSILEKSLENDRCTEPCCFRMVTACDIKDELEILRHPIDSAHRKASVEAIKALQDKLNPKVGDFKSSNKHDCSFWAENTTWDVRYNKEVIENKALLKLRKILEREDNFLAADQVSEIYSRLLNKVSEAGAASYNENRAAKRINRTDLIDWFRKVIDGIRHPVAVGGITKMEEKMQDAYILSDTIETAKEERRFYREEVLKPRYLSLHDRRLMEGEVLAQLQRLKSQLDTGVITQTGPEFHDSCLAKLEEIQESLGGKSKVPLVLLHGSMYDIVNRCLHRFRRVA